jgi:hypothetical protein
MLSFLAGGIALVPASSLAADPAGRARALAEECKSNIAGCEEYLLGVFDGSLITQDMELGKFVVIYPASRPEGSDLRMAFEKWVDENPDKLDSLSRVTGALLALKHTYPCSAPAQTGHTE